MRIAGSTLVHVLRTSTSPSRGSGSATSTTWKSSAATAPTGWRRNRTWRGIALGGGGEPFRHRDHLGDANELHPRSALRLAGGHLVIINGPPAGPGDEPRHAAAQPRLDRAAVCIGRRVEATGSGVLEQPRDGVRGALLVGADDTGRAALDPAGRVLARQRHAVVAGHAAAVVSD